VGRSGVTELWKGRTALLGGLPGVWPGAEIDYAGGR
jgi:hypothetical protein